MKYLNTSNVSHSPCPCSWRAGLTSSILQVAPTWECVFKHQGLRTTTISLSYTKTDLTTARQLSTPLVPWGARLLTKPCQKTILKKYWHTEGFFFFTSIQKGYIFQSFVKHFISASLIGLFQFQGGNNWQNAFTSNKESLILTLLWKKVTIKTVILV